MGRDLHFILCCGNEEDFNYFDLDTEQLSKSTIEYNRSKDSTIFLNVSPDFYSRHNSYYLTRAKLNREEFKDYIKSLKTKNYSSEISDIEEVIEVYSNILDQHDFYGLFLIYA